MSTIFFGVEALANVVVCAVERAPECDARLGVMRTLAQLLARYSEANCAAFRDRYEGRHGSDVARPHAFETILDAALARELPGDREAASTFLNLATYNLDDHETPALSRAIRTIAGMMPA